MSIKLVVSNIIIHSSFPYLLRSHPTCRASIEFVVKPRENLSLVGPWRTIPRVSANEPYPCQMQKTQQFSCLFRHYAKHNGLRKEDLVFSFVDELMPEETPESVHLMANDEIWVERRHHETEEEKPEPIVETPFSRQFRAVLDNPSHSDITFIVGDERLELHCHKVVLSARSDYFSAMLKPGGMKESKKEVLEIDGHSSATFRRMIEFVYTNTVRELSTIDSTDLIALLMLANEYLLDDLRSLCERHAAGSLDKNNIGSLIMLSAKHNAHDLRDACIKYIQHNQEDLMGDDTIREEIRVNPDLGLAIFDAGCSHKNGKDPQYRKRKRSSHDPHHHAVPAGNDTTMVVHLHLPNDQP